MVNNLYLCYNKNNYSESLNKSAPKNLKIFLYVKRVFFLFFVRIFFLTPDFKLVLKNRFTYKKIFLKSGAVLFRICEQIGFLVNVLQRILVINI